jgi:MFS family permease
MRKMTKIVFLLILSYLFFLNMNDAFGGNEGQSMKQKRPNKLDRLYFIPQRDLIVAACGSEPNGSIRFWSVDAGKLKEILDLGKGIWADSLAVSNNGSLIVASLLGKNELASYSLSERKWLWKVDRVGKGVRGAPRDALLAESCSKEERGRSFGFRHAMDEIGAVSAYGLAALVCVLTIGVAGVELEWNAYWWLVALSVIPAAGAVTVLWVMVKEAKPAPTTTEAKAVLAEAKRQAEQMPLGATFWMFLVIMILFTLGNSTDAFLLDRKSTRLNSSH